MAALSGGHLQLFQGGSSTELLYSPELSVMDDDIAGWIGRVLRGARIDDETLAVDVINEVGPIPGNYLGHAHTREWWNKEDSFLAVTDHEPYSSWVMSGRKDMLDRAKEKVQDILASHQPTPLTDAEEEAVEDVLKGARDHYRGKGVISDADWSVYMEGLSHGA